MNRLFKAVGGDGANLQTLFTPAVSRSDALPRSQRHSVVFTWASGAVATVTVRWSTRRRWLRSPDATVPGWQTIAVGPVFLIAVRVELAWPEGIDRWEDE